MAALGEPSLLDMGIALPAGAVGAYPMARRDIPFALAGVPVATALEPPLCTMGLALAFKDAELANGAALLLATNLVSIALAGAAVFLWLGIRPARQRMSLVNWFISLAVLVGLSVPLGSAFLEVVRLEQQTSTVRNVLTAEFEPGQVVELRLVTTGSPYQVEATIRSVEWLTPIDVQDAQDALSEALGREVSLELTNVRAIEP